MQGYRTLELSEPSELHVRNGMLEITQNDNTFSVPLEDLTTIVCIGSNIRMSTMAMSQFAENEVMLMALDNSYHPACILSPAESNARQAKVMHRQISISQELKNQIWLEIVKSKIDNQSRALSILGLPGVDSVEAYIDKIEIESESVDICEAASAKDYFYHYHPRLNRRTDDPINSRLNYGYAVVRNSIIREIFLAGLSPTFGIHHNNQLNAYNLADDLIEPWRPMVDLVAYENIGANKLLNKTERKSIAEVLHNSCLINETRMSVQAGIHTMVLSFKRVVMCENETDLSLPTVLPVELFQEIKE